VPPLVPVRGGSQAMGHWRCRLVLLPQDRYGMSCSVSKTEMCAFEVSIIYRKDHYVCMHPKGFWYVYFTPVKGYEKLSEIAHHLLIKSNHKNQGTNKTPMLLIQVYM
jgi:hypothetical protein